MNADKIFKSMMRIEECNVHEVLMSGNLKFYVITCPLKEVVFAVGNAEKVGTLIEIYFKCCDEYER